MLAPGHGGGRRAAASVRAARDRSCGCSGGPSALVSWCRYRNNRNHLCHSSLDVVGSVWASVVGGPARSVAPRSRLGAVVGGLLGRCTTGSHPLCSGPPALAPAVPTSAGDGCPERRVCAVAGRAERRWCGAGRPLRVVKRAWASWQAAASSGKALSFLVCPPESRAVC